MYPLDVLLNSYRYHVDLYQKAQTGLDRANLATVINRIVKRIDALRTQNG